MIAPVLKTGRPQGLKGSNPFPSALFAGISSFPCRALHAPPSQLPTICRHSCWHLSSLACAIPADTSHSDSGTHVPLLGRGSGTCATPVPAGGRHQFRYLCDTCVKLGPSSPLFDMTLCRHFERGGQSRAGGASAGGATASSGLGGLCRGEHHPGGTAVWRDPADGAPLAPALWLARSRRSC